MWVLPTGFALPPTPYLLGLLAALAATAAALYRRRPPVTEATVAALAPWMAAGGALYALFQIEAVPGAVAPLVGSPAVYGTVAIAAGLTWAVLADRPAEAWTPRTAPGILAGTGTAVLSGTLAVAAVTAPGGGSGAVARSVAILAAAALATAGVWAGLGRLDRGRATGLVGLLAVFGHALDGVSTAVGYDVLGFGEQTPLSRVLIEAGAALPAPAAVGDAWLFVLVKLLVAAVVVGLFDDYVREEPAEGYLLLGLVAAVGLGPGAHNVVLFAIA
ncbi:DUF63 domain-containing protein [Halobacteriales archaeon QS_1_69_70]|nr:MAG: DUF63 domain-containing protein [Halobacteriales archaeon QS_1_69_70]